MSVDYLSQSLNDILSIARLAPSVHNTQPWKVKVSDHRMTILLDRTRALAHGDPTGRQTFISLGIFTEACLVGLNQAGLKAEPKLDGELVILDVSSGGVKNDDDVKAMNRRFTDRTIYKKTKVPVSAVKHLESSWQSANTKIVVKDSPEIIEKTAELTRQALLLAFSNPAFRKELTEHFVDKPSTPYGIPLNTLGTGRLKARLVKRLIRSGANNQQEAQTEYERWLSASGLVFLLSAGDSKAYWLEAGRAYMRASLEIQKLGFNQATSAAIVEAADFHEDIEKLLGTDKRIQSVIRFGRGQTKQRPSGRLTAEQILIT